MRTTLEILAAVATGRVTMTAMRRGMRMGKVMSRPKNFLQGHGESDARLAEVANLLSPPTAPPSVPSERLVGLGCGSSKPICPEDH